MVAKHIPQKEASAHPRQGASPPDGQALARRLRLDSGRTKTFRRAKVNNKTPDESGAVPMGSGRGELGWGQGVKPRPLHLAIEIESM